MDEFFSRVIAALQKYMNFVGDPRTVSALIAVLAVLKMAGVIQDQLSDKDVVALVNSTHALLAAIAVVVGTLASLSAIIVSLVNGWTQRPSRGIQPWLSKKSVSG